MTRGQVFCPTTNPDKVPVPFSIHLQPDKQYAHIFSIEILDKM